MRLQNRLLVFSHTEIKVKELSFLEISIIISNNVTNRVCKAIFHRIMRILECTQCSGSMQSVVRSTGEALNLYRYHNPLES